MRSFVAPAHVLLPSTALFNIVVVVLPVPFLRLFYHHAALRVHARSLQLPAFAFAFARMRAHAAHAPRSTAPLPLPLLLPPLLLRHITIPRLSLTVILPFYYHVPSIVAAPRFATPTPTYVYHLPRSRTFTVRTRSILPRLPLFTLHHTHAPYWLWRLAFGIWLVIGVHYRYPYTPRRRTVRTPLTLPVLPGLIRLPVVVGWLVDFAAYTRIRAY